MPNPTLTPLPPDEAIRFLEGKGYQVGFAWQDVWEAEHARAFTVAKMMEVDLLQEVHASLVTALKDGQSFDQWRKGLEPLLQARGWWGRAPMTDPLTGRTKVVQLGSPRRLKTIFDVNIRMSMAAGQWERIERLKAARPYLRYVAVQDAKVRAEHLMWHGTVLPVGHTWWDAHSPPCGWNCRCTLQQLSAKDLERNGWTVTETPPPDNPRPWLNKRTGEVLEVPAGVDPGFAYHKGKAAGAAERDRMAEKLEAAEPAIARAAVARMVKHPAFADFAGGERAGSYPVAVLDRKLAERIGAKGHIIQLSQETARKQRKHHPEIEAADYALVQEAIDAGLVVKQGDHNLVFIRRGGSWWHAAVKATRTGQALFLTSFRRTSEAAMQRAVNNGELVRDFKD